MRKWVFRECHITTVIYHLGCIMFSNGDLRAFHLYISVEVGNKPVFVIGEFFYKTGKVIWPLNFTDKASYVKINKGIEYNKGIGA